MTKYNKRVKQKFLDLALTNKYSLNYTSELCGVSKSTGKRWWKLYRCHGEDALETKLNRYDGDFRIYAVEYLYEKNLSIEEASAILGIPSASTLLNWTRVYEKAGEEGLLSLKRGRSKIDMSEKKKVEDFSSSDYQEHQVLVKENERLKAENAYLKKLIALKRTKGISQTKKSQR